MSTFLASLLLSTSALAYDVDHVASAAAWVAEINPGNNSYGENASLTWSGIEPSVVAKCGSFLGLAFKETYPGVDGTVLTALTGEASPHAANWYNAITVSATSGTYSLTEILGEELEEGDLLVTAGGVGATDHAMLVATVTDVTSSTDELGKAYKAGPSGTASILLVGVFDASETPHGPDGTTTRTVTDTRYLHPDAGKTLDKGIGYGEILVYTNATGDLLGWRWSIISSTLHVVSGSASTGVTVRPLVGGRLEGI